MKNEKMGKEAHKKRVLVADDEFLIRWSVTEALSKEGYEVRSVEDGKKALEALMTEFFDFVILDLFMPSRDGWEVLEQVKGRYPKTKVIVVTAYGSQETKLKAEERGAYGYVEKPEILEEVKMMLNRCSNNFNHACSTLGILISLLFTQALLYRTT